MTKEQALAIAIEKYEEIGPHLTRARWLAEAVAAAIWQAYQVEGKKL